MVDRGIIMFMMLHDRPRLNDRKNIIG